MKIAILDFCIGEVIIEEIPKKLELLDGDDILSEMGYKISNVEYMIVEDDIDITIKTKECNLKLKLQ